MDFHTYWYRTCGPYNHVTVVGDIQTLLTITLPDEIYTLSNFDAHRDHQATALFVTEALVSLKRSGSAVSSKLYQSIVWVTFRKPGPTRAGVPRRFPSRRRRWGTSSTGTGCCASWCQLVPANLKCQAISSTRTQVSSLGSWLLSWARKDEFFWMSDFGPTWPSLPR